MRIIKVLFAAAWFGLPVSGVWGQDASSAKQHQPLVLAARIPLPNVVGRMDHFTVDSKRNRVIVSGLGNDTVEVVGMFGQRRIRSIPGQDGPQGVVYLPEFDELVVANDNGKVNIYEGGEYKLLKTVDFGDGADNLRYSEAEKKVYVDYGDGAVEGRIDHFSEDVPGKRLFVAALGMGPLKLLISTKANAPRRSKA